MKKKEELKQLHQVINDAFYAIEKAEDFPKYFYDAFLNGDVTMYQKEITEKKTFHENWITTIESYFPSLDKITKTYKTGLRYEQEVNPIEKAKKINSDSVRHLAQNTQYVRDVTPDGFVTPKKILTTHAEIEVGIYENRFVKTLIDRLYEFVYRRHEVVKENVDDLNSKHFNLNANFDMYGTDTELKVNLVTKDILPEDHHTKQESNYKMLGRINFLLKQVGGLKNSQFMRELEKAKPVIPPIMQTSILLKNVDYKNAYHLWLYLDKYHILDFEIETKEKNLTFDRYYQKNVHQMALLNFSYIYGNQEILSDHYQYLNEREYRRKSIHVVTKSLEDVLQSKEALSLGGSNTINEYYLEQNKEIFKKRLDLQMAENPNFEVAFKRAIRETNEITDALYQGFFEYDDLISDEEFFRGSRVKRTTEDDIKDLQRKIRIQRMIREVGEVNYNNQIRFERQLMNELKELNKDYLKEEQKRILLEKDKVILQDKIALENKDLTRKQNQMKNHLDKVFAKREQIRLSNQKLNEDIKDYKEQLKEFEKEALRTAKTDAKTLFDKEKKQQEAKLLKALETLDKRIIENHNKNQEKFKAATIKSKKQTAEKIKKIYK